MRRREFVTLLGGVAAAWPLAARAQQSGPMRRIGVLMESAKEDADRTQQLARFQEELARLGWLEGRTLHTDYRLAAGRADQFPVLAKELVALQPEAILAVSTPVIAALQRETRTIPIVFLGVSDPIGSGVHRQLGAAGRQYHWDNAL